MNMPSIYRREYRNADTAKCIADDIHKTVSGPVRIMEVCGTHTTAIFRHGIRSLLPKDIMLISGPGCPVCVTAQEDIDAFVALSRRPDVIIAVFGDLMRVPGADSSLQIERASGRNVRVVYSAMDALEIARKHPDKRIVFPGVGFETTTPTIAATLITAKSRGVSNFYLYAAHKTVPGALSALMADPRANIDGFLLPGHVSVIIGGNGYESVFVETPVPAVIGGFEPVDILAAIRKLVLQVSTGRRELENAYPRVVTDSGNIKARRMVDTVFKTVDAKWRGIGVIADSGLALRDAFAEFDAVRAFDIAVSPSPDPTGCACGEILIGAKTPLECRLFNKRCTPTNPVGPCMVSTEGTCAAYFRYDSHTT